MLVAARPFQIALRQHKQMRQEHELQCAGGNSSKSNERNAQMVSDATKLFELLDEDQEGRPSPLTCVAIAPSGRRLMVGTSQGMLKVGA